MSDGGARSFCYSVQASEAQPGERCTGTTPQAEEPGYAALFTTGHYFGPGDIGAAT